MFAQLGMLGVIAVLVMTMACGSPGAGGDSFTFDPVPVATTIDGTPIGYDPSDCLLYAPDHVLVRVEAAELDEFKTWLRDIGFALLEERSHPLRPTASLIVGVPSGAVPAAIRRMEREEGVLSAEKNFYSFYFPEATPTPAISCTPTGG